MASTSQRVDTVSETLLIEPKHNWCDRRKKIMGAVVAVFAIVIGGIIALYLTGNFTSSGWIAQHGLPLLDQYKWYIIAGAASGVPLLIIGILSGRYFCPKKESLNLDPNYFGFIPRQERQSIPPSSGPFYLGT